MRMKAGIHHRLVGRGALLNALLLSLAFSAPAPALAQTPTSPGSTRDQSQLYTHRADLLLAPAEGLQRLSLPWAVVQASRSPALADVRVFDAQGQVLPMAWARAPLAASRQRTLALPRFAWPEPPQAGGQHADVQLRLQHRADGSLLSVQVGASGQASTAPNPASTAAAPALVAKTWLLDLSALQTGASADEHISALQLDWLPQAPGLSPQVQVEASTDAQQWRPVTEARLLDLPAAPGAAQTAPRFSLKSLSWPKLPEAAAVPRYVRLRFDTALSLSRSDLLLSRPHPALTPQPLMLRFEPVNTKPGQPPQWSADLQGPVAPLALSVLLPQPNSLLSLRLEQRQREDEDWRPVHSFVAWRLLRAGVESSAPPQPLQAEAARYWRLVGDHSAGGLAAQPLMLQWQWQAPQLVLLARGASAQLTVGREAAQPVARALAGLIPGYQPGDEFQLPQAQLGVLQRQAEASLAQRWAQLWDPQGDMLRRFALWAVLILSVLALAVMARRLLRQTTPHRAEP